MKKFAKVVIASLVLMGIVALAPKVKIEIVEPNAAACDLVSGDGCH